MAAFRRRNRAPGGAAEISSEQWARRLRNGESVAVEVVRNRVRSILAFKGLGIPTHDRDDLEQGIVTEVWQAVERPGFDFEAGFWGFVEVVASRRCIDWLRAQKREPSRLALDLRDERRGPFERALNGERAKIASDILQALEPDCRKLIVMRLHENVPYREIAKTLGKSEGALRIQVHRCIGNAREIFKRMDPEACIGLGEGGSNEPS